MKRQNLRAMAETGIMCALSYLLNLITVYKMPQGGTVSAGAMVPIIVISARRGWKWGVAAGAVSGLLQFMLGDKYSFHPLSILLDYILAYAVVGLADLFAKGDKRKMSYGIVIVVFARLVFHVLSGAVVFYEFAGGQNPWLYSIGYNASYMLPELAVTLVLSWLLLSSKQIFVKK